MRYVIILAALVFATSAVAAEWRDLPLANWGLALQLPADFVIATDTAEATVIENPKGARITVYRTSIAAHIFEAKVDSLIADEGRSWSIGGRTITPDWATYWAANSRWHLLVHLFRPCGDASLIGVRIERPIAAELDEDRVAHSLETAAGRRSCG